MPIEFDCPQCGKLLRTPDGSSGQAAKCPSCGMVINVPEPHENEPLFDHEGPINPYEAPADPDAIASPFGHGPATSGIRPTRIDFGEVLDKTWQIFKEKWLMCAAVAVVCFIISFAAGQINQIVMNVIIELAGPVGVVAAGIMYLAVQVFAIWIDVGLTIFFINTARGRPAEFSELFGGGPYLLRVICATILFLLMIYGAVVVCMGPGIACAALGMQDLAGPLMIVGGCIGVIIAIILALMFFPYKYLIIDQNMGILESLSESRRITSGNKLIVFAIFFITGIAAFVLILFTCGLGLLAWLPFYALLGAVMYLLMIGQPTAAHFANQPVEETVAG